MIPPYILDPSVIPTDEGMCVRAPLYSGRLILTLICWDAAFKMGLSQIQHDTNIFLWIPCLNYLLALLSSDTMMIFSAGHSQITVIHWSFHSAALTWLIHIVLAKSAFISIVMCTRQQTIHHNIKGVWEAKQLAGIQGDISQNIEYNILPEMLTS